MIGAAIRLVNLCRVTFWRLVLRLRGGRLGRRCTIQAGVCLACARHRPIVIGHGVRLMRGVVLSTGERGRIELGDNVYVGEYGVITSNAEVCIGPDTIIAPHANLVDFNHGCADLRTPVAAQPLEAEPIRIGRDVWLGAGATVLKGVTIGEGAVVGAAALVRRDVPARAVAVGVPARVIRYRGPDGSSDGAEPPGH